MTSVHWTDYDVISEVGYKAHIHFFLILSRKLYFFRSRIPGRFLPFPRGRVGTRIDAKLFITFSPLDVLFLP